MQIKDLIDRQCAFTFYCSSLCSLNIIIMLVFLLVCG